MEKVRNKELVSERIYTVKQIIFCQEISYVMMKTMNVKEDGNRNLMNKRYVQLRLALAPWVACPSSVIDKVYKPSFA